jgi:hypothetical protein
MKLRDSMRRDMMKRGLKTKRIWMMKKMKKDLQIKIMRISLKKMVASKPKGSIDSSRTFYFFGPLTHM